MHIARKSMATKKWFFKENATYRVRNTKYLFVFTFLLAATALRAQTWQVGVGNWFFFEKWTNPPAVPNANSVVTVANGGTAQVVGATAFAGRLTVGSTSSIQWESTNWESVAFSV
jgi:hypothetical protein